MPSSENRRRIEIPASLYRELERQARSVCLKPTALATSLLAQALQAAEARGQVPWYARMQATPQQLVCNHLWHQDESGQWTVCERCGLRLHKKEEGP
jgi:hypothetical protein